MFRPMRRKKNEISQEAAKQLLHQERRGVFAVNGDDGYPFAIPVNYYYCEKEGKIYFHGARVGHKVDALKKNDKICFTVYGNETIKEETWAPYMQSVVEWARIEFKETWDAAASLKSICAFANDLDNWGGGYIVIGVQEDNGRPVFPLKGVPTDKLDSYQKSIFAKCKLLRPAYTPIIGVETYQDKQFIVIWCPGGDNRPYSSPKTMEKDNKERIHYIRKASNTVEPSDDEEKDLFNLANRVPFPDGLGGDNIIENTFKGPIHQQLREALQFIKNSIVTKKIVKSADKAEADWVYNYPYAALEEALANAIYHRGYDIREPIEVRVEKDMIEIVSFPGPDRSVTQEGLKRYKVSNRRYRNRRIGDFLKELHLTEGRNTGFGKILRALEENGSPKPEFETDEDHSYFISRLFVHEAFLKEEEPERSQKGAKKEPKKGAERKQNILHRLEENPGITQVELMEEFGLSRKQIQSIIKDLREVGLVERQGSNRSGKWIVKK